MFARTSIFEYAPVSSFVFIPLRKSGTVKGIEDEGAIKDTEVDSLLSTYFQLQCSPQHPVCAAVSRSVTRVYSHAGVCSQ